MTSETKTLPRWCFFLVGVRRESHQRCLITHSTVRWECPMVGPRTKTNRKTTSYPQIQRLYPPRQQMETLTARQCPPHATAPSPALRPNLSLQPPALHIPQLSRNQWFPHAQKVGWHRTVPVYQLSPDQACQIPRPLNPETTETAPNSPANSECRQDPANHSLTKRVRKALGLKFPDKCKTNDNTNSLSSFSSSWSSQDGSFCEVRTSYSAGPHSLYSLLPCTAGNIEYTK